VRSVELARLVRRGSALILALCGCAAAGPPARTLLLEIPNVPAAEQISTGRFYYDGYSFERVIRMLRDTAVIRATPAEMVELQQAGYAPRVVLETTDEMLLYRRAIYGPALQLSPVYHRYDQITALAAALAAAHPQLITRLQIGESQHHHQPIYAYRLSNQAAVRQDRPRVMFNGAHHSDELLGTEIVVALMGKLVNGYGSDAEVTRWLDTLEIYLVPVVNVDGHDMVTSGRDPRWRKNLRDVNDDGVVGEFHEGVNLNRNYDFNWTMGGSPDPAKIGYRGPYPFSESENRAMRDFATDNLFVLSVSYHSAGEVIFYPWSWGGKAAPDDTIIKRIAGDVAACIPRMDSSGNFGPSPWGAYRQSSLRLYGPLGIFDLIIETGKGAHVFPPEEVPGIVAANLKGVSALLGHANGPGLAVKVTDAATGAPLVAQVWLPQIENETVDRHTTDAEFGRRWRLLEPSSHYVIISCPGYRTVALPKVEVGSAGWTPLEVRLERE